MNAGLAPEEIAAIAPLRQLAVQFLRGDLTPAEFQAAYQSAYLAEQRLWEPSVYEILNDLFADVDFYVDDPALRDPTRGDLDAARLRAIVLASVGRLDALAPFNQARPSTSADSNPTEEGL